jgi:glycosyltransferase involved in cell wall biosynthesis
MKNNVAVLLSTYNGSKYIVELLESLSKQLFKDFDLIIRDDGSSDSTLNAILDYQKNNQLNIHIVDSEGNVGAANSFIKLLDYANDCQQYSYFLFCDQDDIWHQDKIEVLVNTIKAEELNNPDLPILVHSDLSVVNDNGEKIFPSFWKFQHIDPDRNTTSRLLIQNTVTGCTAAINRALSNQIKVDVECMIVHDWWIALVASAIGKIVPIHQQLIDYRQHEQNVIGARQYGIVSVLSELYKQPQRLFIRLYRLIKNIVYQLSALLYVAILKVLSIVLGGYYSILKNKVKSMAGINEVNIHLKDDSNNGNEVSMNDHVKQAKQLLLFYGDIANNESKRALIDFSSINQKKYFARKIIILRGKFLPNGFYRALRLFISV